jgi:hypothetical protein
VSLIGLIVAEVGVEVEANVIAAKLEEEPAICITFPLIGKVPFTELAFVVTLEALTNDTPTVSPEWLPAKSV